MRFFLNLLPRQLVSSALRLGFQIHAPARRTIEESYQFVLLKSSQSGIRLKLRGNLLSAMDANPAHMVSRALPSVAQKQESLIHSIKEIASDPNAESARFCA